MTSGDIPFLAINVTVPIAVTELLLFVCARTFGDGKVYTYYSCALRVLAYSPCVIGASHGHGIMPMPVASALLLRLRGGAGDIVWLYGIPEVFVTVCCYFVAFAIRSKSDSSREQETAASTTTPVASPGNAKPERASSHDRQPAH